ncbi:MAG: hypothetical protein RLZZ511_22 [Cyanobacteriota bacterium]|jgi:hypothetical protein
MSVTQAKTLTLGEVKQKLQLEEVLDPAFFPEWQGLTPNLREADRELLDKLRSNFRALQEHSSHEEIVKMFSLAPLMVVAGLAEYPFIPRAEHIIEIDLSYADEDDEVQLIRGKIDIIVSHEHLWQVIVETKRVQSNVMQALPQTLTYMMAAPKTEKPIFGLCTNGTDFVFVKMLRGETNQYSLSEPFTMYRHQNDLYQVVTIMQQLRQIVQNP